MPKNTRGDRVIAACDESDVPRQNQRDAVIGILAPLSRCLIAADGCQGGYEAGSTPRGWHDDVLGQVELIALGVQTKTITFLENRKEIIRGKQSIQVDWIAGRMLRPLGDRQDVFGL